MPMDTLNAESIRRGLKTRLIGQNVLYVESIDSTNAQAKELARQGAPEGMLIITDSQTHGRGRLNRQWLAHPGTSLLMSLILRPTLAPMQAARTTMICSLALADAIETVTGLRVRLKWPNDILIGGRKAGGILTELGLSGNRLDFAVVGIGLNVNVIFEGDVESYGPDQAPDTSRASLAKLTVNGTSLSRELGRGVSRLEVLRQFLTNTEVRYEALQRGEQPFVEWSRRLDTLQRQVTISNGAETLVGWAETVDADGALLVRRADGTWVTVLVGDVTLRTI